MAVNERTTKTSKPGGRPRKPAGDALSELVAVRFTVSERDMLASMARDTGLSESEFIRRAVLSRRMPSQKGGVSPALIADLNRLVLETARTGNNANQLARATHRDSAFQQYWREIGAEIKSVNAALKDALERILLR